MTSDSGDPRRSMAGMSRAELDMTERKDAALGSGPKRPRDAGTLILLDRSGSEFRVLMGRRHMRHAFMPGKFVFPGGRTDPNDGRVPTASPLHPKEEAKLMSGRTSATRARAIAMSAVRETYEEVGLLIGNRQPFATASTDWQGFVEHAVCPTLDNLRLIARAITPPGRVRRYDTRFLAAFRDDVAVELEGGGPTDELEEIVWVPLSKATEVDMPGITATILGDLRERLAQDPDLSPGGPAPFYYLRNNRFCRDLL
jgi:8-oxo-dGTP pyrophosphatase MutT (NUDIX family)